MIVPVFEGVREERFGADALTDAGEVSGKAGELTLLHHPPGAAAARILLAGAGKPEKFSSAELRKLAATALRHLKAEIHPPDRHGAGGAVGDGIQRRRRRGRRHSGRFRTGQHKNPADHKTVESFTVVAPAEAAGIEEGAARGRIVAEAQNYARAWSTSRPTC